MSLSKGEESRDAETITRESKGRDGMNPGQLAVFIKYHSMVLQNGEELHMHTTNPSA